MKKYVVAVSGGADSMTLLDQCVKRELSICVAHVNYQKRATANRDQEIVERYCKEHQIDCFVRCCEEKLKGNFQAAARDFRYDFFKQICEEQGCEAVLVAHQQDDVIETFLLQQASQRIPLVYGLATSTSVKGLRVERPLLTMSKQDCYRYCHDHHIEYGDDESNFSDVYQRNRIRHQIVEQLTREQRQQILDEIHQLNQQKQLEQSLFEDAFEEDLLIQTLLEAKEPCKVLRYWLNHYHLGYSSSDKMLEQVIHDLKEHKRVNLCFEKKKVVDSYGVLQVIEDVNYSYTFSSITSFECPYFKLALEGNSLQAVTLSEEDFPITIRSPQKGDAIQLRYGTKALNRFFIDRKISHKERKKWPIVVNCKGNVILVPEIGCDIKHYTNKPNCFVIK